MNEGYEQKEDNRSSLAIEPWWLKNTKGKEKLY